MKPARESNGIALVIVLACVSLLVALFVMYFATATHAVQTATVYKNGVNAQQLADSAVNIVMGQIADGTHTAKQAAPAESLVWMSQPGLIRTYDTNGAPYRFYKLYSSDDMVVQKFTGGYWSPGENEAREVPDDWFQQRGLFTDLNEPMLVPLDPSASLPAGAIRVGANAYYPNYPILDPAAQSPGNVAVNRDGVEGFAIDAKRVSSVPSSPPPAGYDPTAVTDPRRSPNPAPMPVRWLYVLRNGKISVPVRAVSTADGTLEMQWTTGSADAPTRDNPIVGRIAFWTDDETCKLNINTASEGTFWDRPGAPTGGSSNPLDETNMANRIPRHDEWQRLPGHPAMTCLSPVFGMLPDFQVPLGTMITTANYPKFEAYYSLLPRIGGVDGTRAGLLQPPKPIQNLDKDRLFASVDELLYTPRTLPGGKREQYKGPSASTPAITRSFLEKAKFFLTTSNRAPETNMFNRPRIALWPLQQENDPNRGQPGCPDRPRTPQDDLIAQCSTVGGKPYFFQRYSVYMSGAVNDRNLHPKIPFGQQAPLEPPSSQRTDLDWQIPRNQDLYRYLQDLTTRYVPGVAGRKSFADKFGIGDRDQLLTEMVDLLRSANSETTVQTQNQNYAYAYAVPHDASGPLRSGAGQVVPLIPPAGTPGAGTKGFGRFPTVTEVGLVIFRTTDGGIGAVLWLEPFCPSAGPPATVQLVRYCIRGLDKFKINGKSLDMPPVATSLVSPGFMCQHCAHAHNCYYGMVRYWAPGGAAVDKTIGTASEERHYPFYSRSTVPVPKTGGLNFVGGEITLEIHSGYSGTIGSALDAPSPASLVQTLHFKFPDALWPVPPAGTRTLAGAILGESAIGGFEIVRSVQVDPNGPSGGDHRLIAALRDVPASYFHPHPDYASATKPYAHTFRAGDDFIYGYSSSVSLQPGRPTQASLGANGLKGALLPSGRLGDWDSGAGQYGDGAQFPRLDAGNGDSTYGGYTIVSYAGSNYKPETGSTWSPNREIPSPVIFGSLPVGARAEAPQPWRTLLFCANPASGKYHPGWQQPRDHYMLDFFQMPVVEPYAISEPLSSAGKVNLNSEIAPFTYIRRDTALRGAFRATKITAIANKQGDTPVTPQRLDIDADETLKGFQNRFADKGGCFKTASELCEMYLVPKGATLSAMSNGDPDAWWWKNYASTGDNLRENPYGHLYSRVTARSNTFTVHYRVQALGHNATAHPDKWIDGLDPVLAESRGSSLIERYVDPDNPRLLDFATDRNATLDDAWKFRVVRVQRFGR